MRVRWLQKAIKNLDAEADYIAQENSKAAADMFVYVKNKVDSLSEFPSSGRAGRVPGTRELVVDRFHLLFHTVLWAMNSTFYGFFILVESCPKPGKRN